MTEDDYYRKEDRNQLNLREKFTKFFEQAKELDYSEEVALAAIVDCDCPDDPSDLIMWCLKNNRKEDLIADLCERGSRDPRFQTLFPEMIIEEKAEDNVEEMEVDR